MKRLRRLRHGLLAALTGSLLLSRVGVAGPVAEPMHVRNLHPPAAVFGLPAWSSPPALGHGAVALRLEAGNHYRFSRRQGEGVMLDGETWRAAFSYDRSVGQRWWVGFELPYQQLSGGVLDGLIDTWHSAFGLPDGGREARDRGELLLRLEDEGGAFLHLDARARALGDAQLSFGRRLGTRHGLGLRATIKLPTGDEALLSGSGASDISLTLLGTRERSFRDRPAGYYWGIGAVRLGAPQSIAYQARDWAYMGVLGGGWQIVPRAGLKLQLDLHTPLYRASLRELGGTALQGTLGAWIRFGERATLELGMSEDLAVGVSPDFSVHAGMRFAL